MRYSSIPSLENDLDKLYELCLESELDQVKTGVRQKVHTSKPVTARIAESQAELLAEHREHLGTEDEQHVAVGVQRLVRWKPPPLALPSSA